MIRLPRDFREFLRLLNSNAAEYIVVGGYAVNYHGYSRSTGDIDIWVGSRDDNAARVAAALRQFGFASATTDLFAGEDKIVRIGVPPLRLEILTSVSGLQFDESYNNRQVVEVDGVSVPFLNLNDLRKNKRAAGRAKDLADLDELE